MVNVPENPGQRGLGQSCLPRSSNSKHKLCYRSQRDTRDRDLACRGADAQSLPGDAEANSFRRAMELRPKGESRRSAPKLAAEGDHAGAAIWRRITVAIEQLTDTTGLPN